MMETRFTHKGHDFLILTEGWGNNPRRAHAAAGFLVAWIQTLDQAQVAALHRALRDEDDSQPLYHLAVKAGNQASREAQRLYLPQKGPKLAGTCVVFAQ